MERLASRSVTVYRSSNACGQIARVSALSLRLSTRQTSPPSLEVLSTCQPLEVRAKPWLGSGPRPENCGKQTGIPPRMALPAAYRDADDTKRRSTPSSGRQEVTCAPCR